MGSDFAPAAMAPTRWIADEMLGRLARYLRFVGVDVAYARGLSDDELLAQSVRERRRLVTRDVRLAARSPDAVLLRGIDIAEQWQELRDAWPELPQTVVFERCTLCNGELAPVGPGADRAPPGASYEVPSDRPIFRCTHCDHRFWAGSHTDRMQQRLASWRRAEDRA
jgi:uncharacterized protein with PIN domain